MLTLRFFLSGIFFILILSSCSSKRNLDDWAIKTIEAKCEIPYSDVTKIDCVKDGYKIIRFVYKLLDEENDLLLIKEKKNRELSSPPLDRLQNVTNAAIRLANDMYGFNISITKSNGVWILNY